MRERRCAGLTKADGAALPESKAAVEVCGRTQAVPGVASDAGAVVAGGGIETHRGDYAVGDGG